MNLKYDKTGVVEFGNALLKTGDLDPIYIMLHRASLPSPLLERWSLAYWCYYSVSTASRIAESKDFWGTFRRADEEGWPRGPERRHFRGSASSVFAETMAFRYPIPEEAISSLGTGTFKTVSERILQWPQFGPWAAFKVADMLERVLRIPVDFSDCELEMYREPVAGAMIVSEQERISKDVKEVVSWVLGRLKPIPAPPRGGRLLNVQEAETILCKFKSHQNGRYPIGKDIREIRHSLQGASGMASSLLRFLPGV